MKENRDILESYLKNAIFRLEGYLNKIRDKHKLKSTVKTILANISKVTLTADEKLDLRITLYSALKFDEKFIAYLAEVTRNEGVLLTLDVNRDLRDQNGYYQIRGNLTTLAQVNQAERYDSINVNRDHSEYDDDEAAEYRKLSKFM